MSYEGHYQVLCKKGHLEVVDVYDHTFKPESHVCACGDVVAWMNEVDDTNGGGPSRTGEVVLEEMSPPDKVLLPDGRLAFVAAVYQIPRDPGRVGHTVWTPT